ncbi:MAG TPA: tetratricopeptide repeat protein [Candidatus Acidoferrum sp.]|nr:tetratricopeptide repeat protein [Candidatus Acidoferrum sp.]
MTLVSRRWFGMLSPLASIAFVALAIRGATPAPQKPGMPGDPPAQVTFNRDIAPILYRACARCHHPGEAGPFPLLSYADAKSHGRQIAAVTKERIMPPWLPEPGALQFADELRLSEDEIARIQTWVQQGAAEGERADLPAVPHFAEGWQLGKPDVVVKAAKPYTLPASGADNYWNFVFRAPVDRTRWLKAMEIRPGDKRLVHHANVLVDRQETGRLQEAEPGAGFGGMELTIESEVFDPDSHFLFWKPGSVPYVEPDGMALRLDKDTDLILNTHLQPSGKPETIQPTLGLYFTDKPATMHPILLQLENDRMLDIPPGEQHFVVTDEFTLPVDVDALAIYPHAHYLGKDLQAIAKFRDGRSETLIHIPDWNLNWQAVYRYAQPVHLPKGTTIAMKFVYDNSADNVRNPNDPPQRVVAGNRAVDEMAHLWLQVLPEESAQSKYDPRAEILEAMARHNLQKNPDDFEAHYNLAALLMRRGDVTQAITHFAEANRIRPNEPTANNAYGAALLGMGRTEESIPHLTAALNARPNYFDARYNLGNALASLGDFRGALAQFQAAVRIKPEDANAEANLGSAYAEIGDVKQARLHYQRALQLNPNHELAKENLQELNHQPNIPK